MIYTDEHGHPLSEDDARERFNRIFAREFRKAGRDPAPDPQWQELLNRDGAIVRLLPRFVSALESDRVFGEILTSTPWRDDTIRAYGRTHRVPRRAQYFADSDVGPYAYSSVVMQPQPWSPVLKRLRRHVELATDETFNAALVNLYVDGSQSVGWHADDEHGVGPCIASVSLGASRTFRLRRNADTSDQLAVELEDGDLLVMSGDTQQTWQHSLPKRTRVRDARINVTFRQITT